MYTETPRAPSACAAWIGSLPAIFAFTPSVSKITTRRPCAGICSFANTQRVADRRRPVRRWERVSSALRAASRSATGFCRQSNALVANVMIPICERPWERSPINARAAATFAACARKAQDRRARIEPVRCRWLVGDQFRHVLSGTRTATRGPATTQASSSNARSHAEKSAIAGKRDGRIAASMKSRFEYRNACAARRRSARTYAMQSNTIGASATSRRSGCSKVKERCALRAS